MNILHYYVKADKWQVLKVYVPLQYGIWTITKLFTSLHSNLFTWFPLWMFYLCTTLVIWKILVHWVIQIFQMLIHVLHNIKKLHSCQSKISKILIFAWKLKFYHKATNVISGFPWSNRLTSSIFWENVCHKVWIVSLSIVLSSKNGSPEKERLVQLRLKQLQNYFGMQK